MDLSQIRKRGGPQIVVAVGGLDPGAGAGLGRDLLTARALGAAVRMVGTAWTEQSEGGVLSVEARPPAALADAVRHALRAPRPGAVKMGMIPGPEQAAAILGALAEAGYDGPVVADPVLVASHGGALWTGPLEALWPLLARATVVTPNVPEAERLTGLTIATPADADRAARALVQAGLGAVLLKGGHLPDGEGGAGLVTDLLVTAGGERRFSRPRVPGPSPRGTGCALATALAIHLAAGLPLAEAIAQATGWLAERIAAAVDLAGERQLG